MSVSANKIVEVLGGRRTLGRSVRSFHDLDRLVRDGMPKTALDRLVALLAAGQDAAVLSVSLRNKIVPRATYRRQDRFNLQVGETTERLARLYALAQSVFDDPSTTTRFLLTPHPELEGRVPFDAALTEIGGREVEEIIERGLHGLPA